MKRTEIRALFASAPADGASVTVCGWAKTVRDSKNIGFIELSDGSCFKPLQVVFEAAKLENYKDIAKAGVGTSLVVTGRVVLTPGAKQPLEVNADSIRVLGACQMCIRDSCSTGRKPRAVQCAPPAVFLLSKETTSNAGGETP